MTRLVPVAPTSLIPLVALIAACTWTGCFTRVREGPEPGLRVRPPHTTTRYNTVVYLDDRLGRRVEVQRSDARRTGTNTVEVFVVFRNRTDHRQQIECRAQFYDQEGVALGPPSGWQRVFLEPNTILTWREDSLSPSARYYYVEVREGRSGGGLS